MKVIELTRGLAAIVDDEDFEKLSQWRWYANSKGYATRSVIIGGKGKTRFMHHEIIGTKAGMLVDHINGIRTDNRKQNLRWVDNSQSAINRGIRANSKLKMKGVDKQGGKYRARITLNGKTSSLGLFDSPQEAQEAYFGKAAVMHGEFRRAL